VIAPRSCSHSRTPCVPLPPSLSSPSPPPRSYPPAARR
jgi:hypothetical protein